MRANLWVAAFVGAISSVSPAMAAEVIVNTVTPLPSANTWGTLPSENTGGGTAAVTSTAARSGNGSLEMTGDRTRSQLGIQYSPFATSLGSLIDVTGLTFDWRIASGSTNPYNADYTPALRLLINDSTGTRRELTWEGAYNGVYGAATVPDNWYSSSINDKFYMGTGNENAGQTIAQWASQLIGATVSGFSVGVGSGATTGYHAFADNVAFTKAGVTTTYNFETAGSPGAVPEPATWAMMLAGFGMIGFAARRRQQVKTTVTFA